jgi:ABC-type multidrug transport system permease subunit
MNYFILVSAISESDRRLIIIALIVLVLFFVILGLIGIAIKKTMKAEGEQIDKLRLRWCPF